MKKWNSLTTKEKVLSILIPVVIIILLMVMILGNKDTEDTLNENLLSTEVEVETEINVTETEVAESTEIESEVVEDTEVIVIDDNNDDIWYNGKPSAKKYMDTHEFVGFNENYKSVKGDPRYEIVDGCYKGVPLKGSDTSTSWEYMIVWVSPGGVEIKINDMYAYLATEKDIVGREDAIWTKDPDKNLEPGSEWMIEASKFAYGEDDVKVERRAYGFVDLDSLPAVATTTEKRSSFNLTDELNAYAEQWSIYNNLQMTGMNEYNIANALFISDDYAYPWMDGYYKTWRIDRESDYWKITINRNPNELSWHGLKTCLKNIEPDAELVYDAVYECLYDDVEWIVDFDIWYDIPNSSSEIMIPKGATKGEIWFYLK